MTGQQYTVIADRERGDRIGPGMIEPHDRVTYVTDGDKVLEHLVRIERLVPTTDGWPRTVEEASAAARATLASGATHGSVIVQGRPSPHPPTREQIAEAIAKAEDADYWVDEVRQWEALEQWERDAQPQEYPGMAYEDRESFLRTADAVALIQNGAER